MTDLLHTLPDFPTKSYTHLLPSLEKHLITITDLLTLDALEIAKRAQLPVLDLRRLANHIIAALQEDLGLKEDGSVENESARQPGFKKNVWLKKNGRDAVDQWTTISTLDDHLDAALGGGIPTGYITEIAGESGAGKTQLLLTLLLSAQLASPHGLSRPTLYISTEHPLPTTRLTQLVLAHPLLSTVPPSDPTIPPPSLSRILTLQTPDLESQDHILTYQLPVALARHNIGLVILDSVAANYRAEFSRTDGLAMAQRSAELVRLGKLLRDLARKYDCAVVLANQVADRFAPLPSVPRSVLSNHLPSSPSPGASNVPPPPSSSANASTSSAPAFPEIGHRERSVKGSEGTLLSLDHQQRFFTGWGSIPSETANLKTPSLGLVWSNQIACRIALLKEATYGYGGERDAGITVVEGGGAGGGPVGRESAEWSVRKWRRWMRVVFAPWVRGVEGERGVEFEIWEGGIRAVGGGKGVSEAGEVA